MPYSNDTQEFDQDQDQDQQLSLTGDDLSALHGVALQMQDAGDPRAQKLWNFIGAYSGDGSEKPAFTMRQSPVKATSWQDDLENELWGDAAGNNQPAARANARVDDEDDSKPATDGTGATADFLDDLSGIGLHAYLAMRDPELPGYKDWRDGYFVRNGSNFVSREGEAYTNDALKQVHQVLSHQAGNPLISNLFIGPKFKTADYLVWRNQNFSNDGGPWQDDDGTIYSEPALQEMFGAKFASENRGSLLSGGQPETDNVPKAGSGSGDLAAVTSMGAAQIPFFGSKDVPPPPPPSPPGVPTFAFDKAHINKLTVEQVAGIVFNENRDVLPGDSSPQQLQEAKTAQAHAVINGDRQFGENRSKRAGTATWQVADKFKNSEQYQQALAAARTAFQEDNLGTDPTAGRVFFNNRFEGQQTGPRIVRGSPQDPYQTYGPFTVGGGRVWTVIYDDFKKKK